jgi:2-haloacid dehalogenase
MPEITDVKALTFDAFGTVLDLRGSLLPYISEFLKEKQVQITPEKIWDDWRARQRIEQFQDTIMMVGHSGYLETSRRACV